MILSTITALPALVTALPVEEPAVASISIRADVVYTASGDPIENGLVVCADGKISAVGPAGTSAGDALEVAAITPGLVDLGAWMNGGDFSTEHSTETPAHLRVADNLDPFSTRWDRELRSGVTTTLAAPAPLAVIGGLGVLVKTGGGDTIAERTVVEDACLYGTIGSAPSRFNQTPRGTPTTHFVRRPTTRMGVEWTWRRAFYDAIASRRVAERAFPGSEEILDVLDGGRPLVIGAATTQDIRTAIFLKREFAVPNLIVQGAAELWRDPEMAIESGARFVLPPYSWGGRIATENAFHAWNSAHLLHEAGVEFALSGRGSLDWEARLAMQPAYAMRGGLPFDAALEAVTLAPARLVGADDRIGSIEVGKDADLVLWSGTPFQPSSRVVGVVLNGELVVDPRD